MTTLGIVAPEAATIGTLAAVKSHSSKTYVELSFLQWIGAHPLRREHKVAHLHPELVLRRPRLEEPVLIPITGATGGRRPRARWRATR